MTPLLLVVAAVGPAATACGDRCDAVDCGGGGAYVSWSDGDVPSAATYRLCIDGRCHEVAPGPWEDTETDVMVHAGEGRPDDPVPVRLEAVAEGGAVVAAFSGEREATGRCCKAIKLRVEGPDRLVPHDS